MGPVVGVCLLASLLVVGVSSEEACVSNPGELQSFCHAGSKLGKDSSLLSTSTKLLKKGESAQPDVAKDSSLLSIVKELLEESSLKNKEVPLSSEEQECRDTCFHLPVDLQCGWATFACGGCDDCTQAPTPAPAVDSALLVVMTKLLMEEESLKKSAHPPSEGPQCLTTCGTLPRDLQCGWAAAHGCGKCDDCGSKDTSMLSGKTRLLKEAYMPTSTSSRASSCPEFCIEKPPSWQCGFGEAFCGTCDACSQGVSELATDSSSLEQEGSLKTNSAKSLHQEAPCPDFCYGKNKLFQCGFGKDLCGGCDVCKDAVPEGAL